MLSKKTKKVTLYSAISTVAIGLFLFFILFEKIDRTPLREMDYYKKMSIQLDSFQLDTSVQKGDYLKVGWAKTNITPGYYPSLAGYGVRGKSECIHDSVYARIFVFDNGKNKSVFITLDLLIFPPIIEERIFKLADSLGYKPENFYFSATHSHSAPGGWAAGAAGRFMAGGYDEDYLNLLTSKIVEGIKLAEANKEPSEVGTSAVEASNLVINRLYQADSKIDPWVRLLKIKKQSGAEALLVTYSAHANCMRIKYRCVSGDYPGQMIKQLEKTKKVEFVMYAAGMVGSHTPTLIQEDGKNLEDEAYIYSYGNKLAGLILDSLDSIKYSSGFQLSSAMLDLPLREPHLKISKDWRFRPWIFNFILGDYNPKIKILKINNVVFIGTPCDFSGELMKDFESLCTEKNFKLFITSFNGGYIGYVNVDKYYDLNRGETRDMNWFGPYNQDYFTEIISRILRKI